MDVEANHTMVLKDTTRRQSIFNLTNKYTALNLTLYRIMRNGNVGSTQPFTGWNSINRVSSLAET